MHTHNTSIARPEQIQQVLDGAAQYHGGTLVIDGLSGMGKTFFLRKLAAEAQVGDPWAVTFVSADRLESGEPYSFIERLLAAGIAPDWQFDPESQQQPIVVARQCVRHVTDRLQTTGPGHLVLIDDAQWIDPESVKVLRHMIPRFNRRNVLIACGARIPHAPSSLSQYLIDSASGPQDRHFELQPLTADDIRALAYERFGVSISRGNAAALQDISGGSFLGVNSLFSQVTDEEIHKLHTAWNIPIRHLNNVNPLLAEYADLSPNATRVGQVVCLAEHELTPTMLRNTLARLELPDATSEALQSGMIRESDFGQSIVPRHDLIASAVRETVEPAFARRVHSMLADVTDGFRSVRHLLKGSETLTAELHERTDTYVADAMALNQAVNAIQILRMALLLAQEETQRQQLITDLVLINIRARTGYQCLDLLPEIESMPHSILREFMAVMLRVYLVEEPFPQARVEALVTAPSDTPDDRAVQAFLMFMMVMMTLRSPNRARILELIPAAQGLLTYGPQHADELCDQRLAWMVTPQETALLLDCYKIVQWHLNGDVEATRNAIPGLFERVAILPDGPAKADCLVPLAGAAMATGDAVLAHDLAARAVYLLDHVPGDAWATATPRIILAHTLLLFGEYSQATRVLDDLEDMSHEALDLEARLTGAALRAMIDVVTGGGQYKQYLAHATRAAQLHWEHYGRDLAVMAAVEVARVGNDHEAVVAATARPELAGFANTQHGYLTYAAHALLTLGRINAARKCVAQLTAELGTTWFEYWGSLDWLTARLAEAAQDTTLAHTHYQQALTQRRFPLPHALAAIDYARFLLAERRVDAAETTVRGAIGTLKKIGATAYLPTAKALLNQVVEHTRSARADVFSAMTERERQVAELLAAGRSNRDIAQQLVISESTVRFHVSNILRKLQLTSRAEVSRFLDDA